MSNCQNLRYYEKELLHFLSLFLKVFNKEYGCFDARDSDLWRTYCESWMRNLFPPPKLWKSLKNPALEISCMEIFGLLWPCLGGTECGWGWKKAQATPTMISPAYLPWAGTTQEVVFSFPFFKGVCGGPPGCLSQKSVQLQGCAFEPHAGIENT